MKNKILIENRVWCALSNLRIFDKGGERLDKVAHWGWL